MNREEKNFGEDLQKILDKAQKDPEMLGKINGTINELHIQKNIKEKHDLYDFLRDTQENLQKEYGRIQKHVKEDPGTAGDQGEENWASLLRSWLPSYFQIVTKGQILFDDGHTSPQLDVFVLYPSYPQKLLDKKLFLAGGIAAVFECKITLKAFHIADSVEKAASIRDHLPKHEGSPYKELNSTILYGLLAHSHDWKKKNSKPVKNIENNLWKAEEQYVKHPIHHMDFLTVSDIGTWQTFKVPRCPDSLCSLSGLSASTINMQNQKEFFTPIGAFLAALSSKLAWKFHDMQGFSLYYKNLNLIGNGVGKMHRWPIKEIYSHPVAQKILQGGLADPQTYDEWSCLF